MESKKEERKSAGKIDGQKLKTIAEIKKFYPLSDDQILQLEKFVDALISYNQKYNLIGKSTIENIWQRHILDSAQIIKFIKNKEISIGDFGSGSGLPGIILSILGIKEVHLIEKSFRKCEFLKIAAEISPGKIVIWQKRAEEINDLKIDLSVSRAFASLDKLLKITKKFLKKDASCLFLKGSKWQEEINIAKNNHSFNYGLHSSLTSSEGKIILINF